MENLAGIQLGPYQVMEAFGEGGMATIYKGYQPSMERYVALKVLPRKLAESPEFVGRFKQEAKMLANLMHPHILPVFDYGDAQGYTYIVMPLVSGGTLAQRMSGGRPIPMAEIVVMMSQVGSALGYAHSRGLVHRDIKPSNVLIDENGNCLLTDFGIAKLYEANSGFTNTGALVGTPSYMSPEQAKGVSIDYRSDIYSLGVILYEMATGRVPYQAETPIAVAIKHIQDPLPLPKIVNPGMPDYLERIIVKALAKNPENRYQSAGALVEALQAMERGNMPDMAPVQNSTLIMEGGLSGVSEPSNGSASSSSVSAPPQQPTKTPPPAAPPPVRPVTGSYAGQSAAPPPAAPPAPPAAAQPAAPQPEPLKRPVAASLADTAAKPETRKGPPIILWGGIGLGVIVMLALCAIAAMAAPGLLAPAATATEEATATEAPPTRTPRPPTASPTPGPSSTPAPTSTPAPLSWIFDGEELIGPWAESVVLEVPLAATRMAEIAMPNEAGIAPDHAGRASIHAFSGSRLTLDSIAPDQFFLSVLPGSDVFIKTMPFPEGAEIVLGDFDLALQSKGCMAVIQASNTNTLTGYCLAGECKYRLSSDEDFVDLPGGNQVQIQLGEELKATTQRIAARDRTRYEEALKYSALAQADWQQCTAPPPPTATPTKGSGLTAVPGSTRTPGPTSTRSTGGTAQPTRTVAAVTSTPTLVPTNPPPTNPPPTNPPPTSPPEPPTNTPPPPEPPTNTPPPAEPPTNTPQPRP